MLINDGLVSNYKVSIKIDEDERFRRLSESNRDPCRSKAIAWLDIILCTHPTLVSVKVHPVFIQLSYLFRSISMENVSYTYITPLCYINSNFGGKFIPESFHYQIIIWYFQLILQSAHNLSMLYELIIITHNNGDLMISIDTHPYKRWHILLNHSFNYSWKLITLTRHKQSLKIIITNGFKISNGNLFLNYNQIFIDHQ